MGVNEIWAPSPPSDQAWKLVIDSGLNIRFSAIHFNQIMANGWSRIHSLLDPALAAGRDVVATLASDKPLPSNDRLAAFCSSAASEFKGQVGWWELLNEPPQSGDQDAFLTTLETMCDAILNADPSARIVGCAFQGGQPLGTSGVSWLQSLMQNARWHALPLQKITLHLIPAKVDPVQLLANGLALPKLVRSWGEQRGLWLDETGISADPNFVLDSTGRYQGDQGQVNFINDVLTQFLAAGWERVYWAMMMRGLAQAEGTNYGDNGLITVDQQPTPGWDALKALAQTTAQQGSLRARRVL